MTTHSTIDVLKAKLHGQELPDDTPISKKKPEKAPIVMTPEQLAERERIRARLMSGTSIVEFTKVDGTKSIMQCTLDPTLLPPADAATATRPEQNHLLHVYSIDRQGWRSFLVNNVTKIY